MRKRLSSIQFSLLMAVILALGLQTATAQLRTPEDRDAVRLERLKEEIRHQLVTLSYYSVFDWLTADVRPDGGVTLNGQVVRESLKRDAETQVKRLEGVQTVNNNIEVLPLSTTDDSIRIAVYRALFNFESPLFRYGTQAVPPIHIIVKNGRVWLKGIVASPMDSQLAYTAARQVAGVFEIHNELQIEGRLSEEISRR